MLPTSPIGLCISAVSDKLHIFTRTESLPVNVVDFINDLEFVRRRLHDNVFDENATNSFLRSSVLARLHCSKKREVNEGGVCNDY